MVVDVWKDEQEEFQWLKRVNKSLNFFPHYRETRANSSKGCYMYAIIGSIIEMEICTNLSN